MPAAIDIHRQLVDAWNRRDFEAMRNLYHPDYIYTGPDGQVLRGPDAGVQLAKMYARAFPDGVLQITRAVSQGDIAVAELSARGTHNGELNGIPPSGKAVQFPICNIIEVRDGKLFRENEYFDTMTMLVQIGAVTPPGRTAGA